MTTIKLKGSYYKRNSDGDLEVCPAPVEQEPVKESKKGRPTYEERIAVLDAILVPLERVES